MLDAALPASTDGGDGGDNAGALVPRQQGGSQLGIATTGDGGDDDDDDDTEYDRQLQKYKQQVVRFRKVQKDIVEKRAEDAQREVAAAKERMQAKFQRDMDSTVRSMAADFKVRVTYHSCRYRRAYVRSFILSTQARRVWQSERHKSVKANGEPVPKLLLLMFCAVIHFGRNGAGREKTNRTCVRCGQSPDHFL